MPAVKIVGSFLILGLCFAPGAGAQTWTEVDDAGDLPGTAQPITGTGPLSNIIGRIDFLNVDMYEIVITGDGTFSALAQGESPLFLDPLLILFDSAGRGLYANDNIFPPDPFFAPGTAALPANHQLTPMVPGHYFLAISARGQEPISSGGFIFPCLLCAPSGVFGPTGVGGALPVSGWSGFPFSAGTYRISLTGAAFIDSDTTPPSIAATVTGTQGLGGWYTSDVNVSWNVTDPNSPITAQSGCGPTTITVDTTGVTFTCTATSGGGTNTATVTIRRDATPPDVACSSNVSMLWPPSGKLVPVQTAVSVTDSVSGPSGYVLDSFATSEGELTSNVIDWTLGTSDTAGFLRASRLGFNDGRSYLLFYIGADAAGNQRGCTVTVFVPHDRGKKRLSSPW